MPKLVIFMLRHVAIGFAVAIVAVGALLALDPGGIGTLMTGSSWGLLAAGLLAFFLGLTFASVQMGIAIMSLKGESPSGSGGGADMPLIAQPAPVAVRHTNQAAKPPRRP
ncbi:MAG: hypothetical protein JNL25_15885 [Rhodospirillaceae bacterium]|nr:hypothetical protein [Rhodospirillaceae bacterium]